MVTQQHFNMESASSSLALDTAHTADQQHLQILFRYSPSLGRNLYYIAVTRQLVIEQLICRDQPTAIDLETTSIAIKEGRS